MTQVSGPATTQDIPVSSAPDTVPAKTLTKITIAFVRDIEAITPLIEIGRRFHSESIFSNLDYDVERLKVWARRELARPEKTCILCAYSGDKLVGFLVATLDHLVFSATPIANMSLFYVLPEHRGSSAAVKLLSGYRAWAKHRGAACIFANVISGIMPERTDRFLRHMGFKCVGGGYVA